MMNKRSKITIIVLSLIAFWTLTIFFVITYSDTGIESKLPELPEKIENSDDIDLSNALNLHIDEQSQILVGDKIVSINDLNILVENYYKVNKSQSLVVLKYNSKTRYDIFVSVMEAVVLTVKKLRNEYALEHYNKEFNLLDQRKSKIIKELYPRNIKAVN